MIAVLKKIVQFTGKHLRWYVFFDKVSGLNEALLNKNDANITEQLWISGIFLKAFYRTQSLTNCFC